jgi:hypothetical protein
MKFESQNNAPIPAKNQPVFSEKIRAEIRLKLRQFVEIEYLNMKQKKASIKK